MAPAPFAKGDKVEVKRKNGAYFAAVVLGPPAAAARKNLIFVEFQTIVVAQRLLKEYVDLGQLRPMPPFELNRYFKPGDYVDAFLETEGGWRRATVSEILENSKYAVDFGRVVEKETRMEVEQHNLRIHREWKDGSWFPPVQDLQVPHQGNGKPRKSRVKHTCGKKKPVRKFKTGQLVEVTSNEVGFRGSWFSARVVASVRDRNDSFLVEYLTLKTDDETKPLTEPVKALFIRPHPPELPQVAAFSPLQEVDAWYNEGWWVGIISGVLDHARYMVHFSSTGEELEFEHSKLRLHQDWMHGRWTIAAQETSVAPSNSSNKLRLVGDNLKKFSFGKGMMVEVKSDEPGYKDAWYQGVIVDMLGNDKYSVEYLTLTTEDGTEKLREEAYYSYIRPFPPCISHTQRYELLDNVDAWFNDGWWMGKISRVLPGCMYLVYFKSTDEQMQFEHINLRPRHDWTGEKWIPVAKDKTL